MSDIKDFVIEDGILVKYVGNDSSVTIPDGVVALGKFCFENADVEEIILSSTVESIFDAAFNETPNLQRIVVDSVNAKYCSVDGCLYSKDKKRFICSPNRTDTLHVAEGCEVIEPYAFFQRRVAGIVFPNTLKRFEHSALCNCHIDADELVIPGVEFRGGEWFNATILPPRVVLKNFSVIPGGAFTYCSFGSMHLPNGLIEIEDWAFSFCNMGRIYVPKTVERLGENVFAIERPIEQAEVEREYVEEYTWYCDEEQDAECEADTDPIDNLLSCPVGFLLGVDNEECAAAQYARNNNIPYEIITNIDAFLNVR